jgi:hypothetical protein
VNRSKTKGTAWETAIVDYLHGLGFTAVERRALAGILDKGDIAGIPGVVIEAKACQTWTVPEWLRETTAETGNAGAWLGACWAKIRGKAHPADGAVIMTGQQFGFLLLALKKAGALNQERISA